MDLLHSLSYSVNCFSWSCPWYDLHVFPFVDPISICVVSPYDRLMILSLNSKTVYVLAFLKQPK